MGLGFSSIVPFCPRPTPFSAVPCEIPLCHVPKPAVSTEIFCLSLSVGWVYLEAQLQTCTESFSSSQSSQLNLNQPPPLLRTATAALTRMCRATAGNERFSFSARSLSGLYSANQTRHWVRLVREVKLTDKTANERPDPKEVSRRHLPILYTIPPSPLASPITSNILVWLDDDNHILSSFPH